MRLRYLSEAHGHWIRNWCGALRQDADPEKGFPQELFSLGRGDRAHLRRAASIEELETERAANLLIVRLLRSEWKNNAARIRFEADPSALLMVSGVLASVKSDAKDGKSLAWRIGAASAAGGDKASLNEMRFKRLLQARNLEEFFLLARRAVQMANGIVDVPMLADDLLAWAFEQQLAAGTQKPAKSLCFRWAQDYYQPVKEKDAAGKETEETFEGEMA
jgi:CRISPR system Cascade subunit CasB